MSERETLRVALLGEGDRVRALDASLRDAGHLPSVLADRPVPLAEAMLRRRGFTPGLTAVPAAISALLSGDFDVVHAFSPPAARAALEWRRRRGGLVVFTCEEELDRASVADRRQRLPLLRAAVEDSNAVTAPDERRRAALARWMAADSLVVADGDVDGYVGLYRERLRGAER